MTNILITGLPGSGKTTLIGRLIPGLEAWSPAGFTTEEIREGGVRRGFEWVDLGGARGVLSHVGLKSPHRLGRYGVDIGGFERYLAALGPRIAKAKAAIVDEIGKMECLSEKFRSLLLETLESDRLLVATAALHGTPFIEAIKRREDVRLFHLRPENRDTLGAAVLGYLGARLPNVPP